MITIVIADDEKLIRAGLKKILTDSLDISLNIIEAKNGQEALNFCEEKHPDILITDIRMPVMDGVELMKALSLKETKPKLIVLSGFDDFSYVKAAIQSGASTYILKPVDKKELINSVNAAISDSRKEEKERNEQTLRSIVDEGRIVSNSGLMELAGKKEYFCISIYGKDGLPEFENTLGIRQFYVLEEKSNFVCIVLPKEDEKIEYDKSLLDYYTIGVSNVAKDFSVLRNLRKNSFIAALECFFDEDGHIIGKKRRGVFKYDARNRPEDFFEVDQVYEKMVAKLDIASSEEIQAAVNEIFNIFTKSAGANSEILYYLYNKIITNLFVRFPGYSDTDMYLHLKGIMIESIFEYNNLAEWSSSIVDYTVYLTALLKQNTKEASYITDSIEYIKTHFTKNINMAMVANYVSVNYTWFSEQFKQHTGINFNEYLKRLRLEESKRLLEKGCYKVYEVANRSGFGDVKYFMKIFRESTGMSPTEWKNRHSKSDD